MTFETPAIMTGMVRVMLMALLMTHLVAPDGARAWMASGRALDTLLGAGAGAGAGAGIVIAVLLSTMDDRRRLAGPRTRDTTS